MGEQRARVRCVPAVPSWVSLTAGDLKVAQSFYGPLLGWSFEPGPDRWGSYVWAVTDDTEVAGIGVVEGDWQPPVAWTTYFGTESADRAGESIRERGGTSSRASACRRKAARHSRPRPGRSSRSGSPVTVATPPVTSSR